MRMTSCEPITNRKIICRPELTTLKPVYYTHLEVAIAGEAEGDLDFVTQAWASEEDFEEALGELENISAIDTDVSLEYGDKLVTLFTCVRAVSYTHLIFLLILEGKCFSIVVGWLSRAEIIYQGG